MKHDDNTRKINWHIGIPVVLWIFITTLGIIKVLLSIDYESTCKEDIIISLINTFNNCTFSTFVPVVVCMLYQYFTVSKEKSEEVSGLAMRYIPAIFILTSIYCVAAVFDAAINYFVMAAIFFVINIAYVICFFSMFLAKKKK